VLCKGKAEAALVRDVWWATVCDSYPCSREIKWPQRERAMFEVPFPNV